VTTTPRAHRRLAWKHRAAILAASLACAQASIAQDAHGIEVMLRLQGTRSPAQADCLILSNSGRDLIPSRHAWGGGAARQPYCGFATQAEQEANGQSVWIIHTVTAPRFGVADTGINHHPYVVIQNKRTGACLVSDHEGDISRPSTVIFPGSGPYCGATAVEIRGRYKGALWTSSQLFDSAHPMPLISYTTDMCLIFSNRGADIMASMYNWSTPGGNPKYCGLPTEGDLLGTNQGTLKLDFVW
jgi:hypothetical protein